MRTTLTIDDNLLLAAKELARQQNLSLSRFVNDTLEEKILGKRGELESRNRFKMLTFQGSGGNQDLSPTEIKGMMQDNPLSM